MPDFRARFPHTLPVWPVDEKGHCTCYLESACRRPGKHADADAPADAPGYAVLCGPGGVLVVDVDVKGGVDGFEELKEWNLPETFEVHTPSGGRHLYYVHPGGELTNRGIGQAIDIRANPRSDGGHSYVIGPGSPGYLKTENPCKVVPGDPYEVAEDAPLAPAPETLVAFLAIDAKEEGEPVAAIDATHPAFELVCKLFAEDCKTYEPSKEDGQGSANLMAIVRRAARRYQLPDDTALEIIQEHWNPRCTKSDGVTPYPWDDGDILRALKRSRASGPGEGMADELLARENGTDLAWKMRLHTKPKGMRDLLPAPAGRKQHDPAHTYMYKIGELAATEADKVSFNALIQHFTSRQEWSGAWQYNAFADQVVCVDPPIELDAERVGLTDNDVSKVRSCLEFMSISANEKDIQRAVHAAARAHTFHPVREYLASLPPGNTSVFDGLGREFFGDQKKIPLPSGEVYAADEFLRRFLVAAVRRILEPGCQVDSILILHGPEQGEGKTKFVEVLFGKDWMRRGLPSDLANRDASHALRGKWCVELGELAALLRTEKNAAKDFISWTVDEFRQYGNGERVRLPRECVFIGTTNDDDFLRDATGNRRYWPVSIPPGYSIPLSRVAEMRDAIWAAALALAATGAPHWFSREEERTLHVTREPFLESDSWEDKIRTYCQGKNYVKTADVFTTAIGGELKDFDRRKLLRITDTLRRIGCKSTVRDKTKQWEVPSELAAKAPAAKLVPMKKPGAA